MVLMLSISVGVCGTWLIANSFSSIKSQRIESIQNAHKLAMYTIASSAGQSGWDKIKLQAELSVLERQSGQLFRLTDKSGRVLYQKQYNDKIFQSGIIDKISENTMAWRVQRDTLGKHEVQIAGAIGDGQDIYYLEGIYSIEGPYKLRSRMISSFMVIVMVLIAVSVLIARKIAYLITNPLTMLADTACAIADGDLSKRVEILSNDEIGQLAYDFNRMANQVSDNINKLEQTMERQENFMASFAHEMRTPMTSIIGYADLMRTKDLPPDMRRQAANYIFQEGKRLESLSNKLLDIIVLRKTQIKMNKCKMSTLIKQACGLFEKRMKDSNIDINIHADESMWTVEPDLFKTLINNLLDNARKAMQNGGKITIDAHGNENTWEMIVKDTGIGIPEEDIPKLTDAFYRVDKARSRASGGTGLGLRLCKEIIDLHNGDISFQSKLGEGTTVCICFRKEGI